MTIKHNEVITAIMGGWPAQILDVDGKWMDLTAAPATQIMTILSYPEREFRVKPKTVVRYGVLPDNEEWWGHSRKSDATNGGSRPCIRAEFVDGRCISVTLEDAE